MTHYSNYKDYELRKNLEKNEKKFFLLKSFLFNQKSPRKIRFKIMLKIDRIYSALFTQKVKNRCIFSTKVRAVYRQTNLTKSSFRDNVR